MSKDQSDYQGIGLEMGEFKGQSTNCQIDSKSQNMMNDDGLGPKQKNLSNQAASEFVQRVSTADFMDVSTIRKIHIVPTSKEESGSDVNFKYPNNRIQTAKYNIITFIPLSLLYQFRRIANIYFLIISILTAMPFSPKNPVSMGGTFAFVLVLTMIKEAYEDYFRHQQDNHVNSLKILKLNKTVAQGKFQLIRSKEIQVGDIVRIEKNQEFPADLLLLQCSDSRGIAYINTMNLDGETNLKERRVSPLTDDVWNPSRDKDNYTNLCNYETSLFIDKPNPSLVIWNACQRKENSNNFKAFSIDQQLLRGCMLKNTEFIIGIVCYTGHETKIMLNSKKPPSKVSNVLKLMNKFLISIFAFQAFICFFFAILAMIWQGQNAEDHDYLELDSDPNFGTYIIQVLTYYVAYSHLIPISLYIALEVLKILLKLIIEKDRNMYFADIDKKASVRNSDLIEELGQVEFVFSDKTGTLTQNVMEFRKCYINGKVFGENENPGEYQVFKDSTPSQLMQSKSSESHDIKRFFTHMSLCHSVFSIIQEDKSEYQGSSPDEVALVEGSRNMGIEFLHKKKNKFYILDHYTDQTLEFEQLAELPFTSDRKRMSVIVQNRRDEKYYLLTKGADSGMIPNLNIGLQEKNLLEEQLERYACDGLRTLVMGQRELQKSEFDKWDSKFQRIMVGNAKDKSELIDKQCTKIETDLELVGASAIEDKLQNNVPQTIQKLMEARIRVWVLTGDKQQTAIEIGKSCNLIRPDMNLIILSASNKIEVKKNLKTFCSQYEISEDSKFEQLEQKRTALSHQNQEICVVIDGQSLEWILLDQNQAAMQNFFKLGFIAVSMICCRVTPAQKSQVVQLAKTNGKWITLSIGDGANDVSMIQTAHIGVGIVGKEGTQAVQSSDFALAQFEHLTRLLLVHGRWGYRRISWFICYYFYKNITVVFTEIWFVFFNGYSGQIYFLDWLPMLYNSFWTSWPCLAVYLLEQDVGENFALSNPQLYVVGQQGHYFTLRKFWKWVCFAILHGFLCFWGVYACLDGPINDDGELGGLWFVSSMSFTLIIFVVTYKLFLESLHWTWLGMQVLFRLIGILSIFFYFLSVLVLSSTGVGYTFQPEAVNIFYKFFENGIVWILILFGPFLVLMPDLIWKITVETFFSQIDDRYVKFYNDNKEKYIHQEDSIWLVKMFAKLDKFKQEADIHRKALRQFGSSCDLSNTDAERLQKAYSQGRRRVVYFQLPFIVSLMYFFEKKTSALPFDKKLGLYLMALGGYSLFYQSSKALVWHYQFSTVEDIIQNCVLQLSSEEISPDTNSNNQNMSARFKPIHFDEANVGRRIKSTKKKLCWKFELDGKEHVIDFYVSRLSGKRTILLDGDIKHKTKHAGIGVTYPIKMNRDILLIVQNGDMEFDLRVNSVSFNKMMYRRGNQTELPRTEPAQTEIRRRTPPQDYPNEQSEDFIQQQIEEMRKYEMAKKRKDEQVQRTSASSYGQDPFGGSSKQKDPFGSSSDPFGDNNDPFGSRNTDPFGDKYQDPFATGSKDNHPFGNKSTDPFSNKSSDPFSNSSDPFSSNQDPFASNSDPFQAKSNNAYGAKPQGSPFRDEQPREEQKRIENRTPMNPPQETRKSADQKPQAQLDLLDTPNVYIPSDLKFQDPFTSNQPTQQPSNPFDSNPAPKLQEKKAQDSTNLLFDLDNLHLGNNYSPAVQNRIMEEQKPVSIGDNVPNVPMNQMQQNQHNQMLQQQFQTSPAMQQQMMNPMMQQMMYQQFMTNMMMNNMNQYQGGHK